MNWLIRVTKIFAIVLVVVILASWLYSQIFSMDKAEEFEVNDLDFNQHLLIATQGSKFKDSLLVGLVNHFKEKEVYIKVIDVHQLPPIEIKDWNAICLIHTWENQKPPKVVESFVDRVQEPSRIVTFATSTFGGFKIKEVDGFSGASRLSEVPSVTQILISKLEQLLKEERLTLHEQI